MWSISPDERYHEADKRGLIHTGITGLQTILMLHIVEALVQAYIFGMLALIYIAGAIQSQQLRQETIQEQTPSNTQTQNKTQEHKPKDKPEEKLEDT